MIRREIAAFSDNVLKLFDGHRTIRKKELGIKYKGDIYTLVQTQKHLKILEADGLISNNGLDEYHLQPKGLHVLNDMERLGYLARHKVAALEFEKEEQEEEWDGEWGKGINFFVLLDLIFFFFTWFCVE